MGATNIKCPSGHSNLAGQKFCGECGVSLPGVCPNGHLNTGGQRYCGECGNPTGDIVTPSPLTEPEVVQASEPDSSAVGVPDAPDPIEALGPTAAPETSETGNLGDGAHSVQPGPTGELRGEKSTGKPRPETPNDNKDRRGGTGEAPGAPFGGFQPPVVVEGFSDLAAGATGRIKAQWAKLPKWGRIGIAVGLPIAAVLLVFSGGRDEESYVWGYHRGQAGMVKDWARGTSAKEACRGDVKIWIKLPSGKNLNEDDAVDGCVAAVNGRPLGAG